MYASSWFLTLYTTALNLNLICCRIMDVFLSEGMEMIFKIALALLTIGKETVLSLDMEAMLKVSLCINIFIELTGNLKVINDLILVKFSLFFNL
jgi:hypothetical protein